MKNNQNTPVSSNYVVSKIQQINPLQNGINIMKRKIITLILCAISTIGLAQNPTLAVVSIDVQVADLEDENLTELVRIQLLKYNRYQVMDRYEIADVMATANIDPKTCLSLTCLKTAGEALKVDNIISGSLDKMGDVLYMRLRLMDVKSGVIEKEILKEFLDLPEYINTMITLSLNDLFDVPNDKLLEKSITSKNNYENAVNNPNYSTLQLSGPRMGYAFFSGNAAKTLKADKKDGGYEAFPALFQFGYQFEEQYLSEGKFQALFEFIPAVLGLDQGMFVPSFTFLNGLRNNVNGFEFAFGPNISFIKEALYFQSANGDWIYKGDQFLPEDARTSYRMDSRGEIKVNTSIVIALGTSFRSGKMNIPVNLFMVPNKENFRYGISFGFNARA